MKSPQLVSFAAIDSYPERLVERATEKKMGGREWVTWGEKNTYPFYIKMLVRETPTLRSVIMGVVDYICGNDIRVEYNLTGREPGCVDRKGTTFSEFVNKTAEAAVQIGGWPWKVTLNNDGSIGELEVLPYERVRTDEDNAGYWYGEKFDKGRNECIFYPRWTRGTRVSETVLFVKLWGDGAYPEPLYVAALKDCETERAIADYHLGNISRGFMGSYLVNFNSGIRPTDEEKREVERTFTEKFGGHKNAGRIMFSWNLNKDAQTTFQKMEVSDYGEKYETLAKHCRQQIFTAFRANPNLFGIATESNGFNSEEYESAFKLFNRTIVQPIQRKIVEALEKVLGVQGVIAIEPFSLDGTGEKEVA